MSRTAARKVMDSAGSLERARQVLADVFGFRDFRSHQADIIATVISGGDALALMPTGGGKSLCYQIPALVRPGTGIVVSPLIALMQDQVEALTQAGVKAAFLNSTLDYREQTALESRVAAGAPRSSSTSRPSGCCRTAPCACSPAPSCRCSPSTRRTASRSGGTTSAPNTASSRCSPSASPTCRASRSPPPPTSARARRSSAN